MYRWHSSISPRDEEWTDEFTKEVFGSTDAINMPFHALARGLERWGRSIPEDPLQRPFNKMQRGPDGTFDDDALVEIMADSIEDVSGSFGANRVPRVLRAVEVLGIMQARSWHLASLKEFREHCNLKRYETFEEINPDPDVASQLRHLYDHPDHVELYPGIVVEAAKEPMTPGSGLCPSFTVSRAILSDAVALVRGDRFYTVDYTPHNLTAWGFQEASADIRVDQGHVFYKLFLRAFPPHFRSDSVYAHFPLVVPGENRAIHRSLGIANRYSYARPAYAAPPAVVLSYAAVQESLNDEAIFQATWSRLLDGRPKRPGRTEHPHRTASLLLAEDGNAQLRRSDETATLDLVRAHTAKVAGITTIDIVDRVGNPAAARAVAEYFVLPLRAAACPHAAYSERELYDVANLIATYVCFDADPAKSFPLSQAARRAAAQLGRFVVESVRAQADRGILKGSSTSSAARPRHRTGCEWFSGCWRAGPA